MTKLLRRALADLAAAVAGVVATPAAMVAVAAVDWSSVPLTRGGLSLEQRQQLLIRVGRLMDRIGFDSLGCALRRHASYLPYDQAAREYLRHILPAELQAVLKELAALAEIRARTAAPAAVGSVG